MSKAVEKTIRIQNIRLVEKHGGQSGDVVNEYGLMLVETD
jgi:cyclic pyranopterin phosphate synthase